MKRAEMMRKVPMKELMGEVGSMRCIERDEGSGEYAKYILQELKRNGVLFMKVEDISP